MNKNVYRILIICLAFLFLIIISPFDKAYASDDHGDNMTSATAINLDENVEGTMNSLTDKDFFKFTTAKSGIHYVTITWFSSQSMSTNTVFYDSNGTVVNTGNNQAVELEANKTYYMEISNNLFYSPFSYKFTITFTGDDFGNNVTGAGQIQVGAEMDAIMNYPGDLDYFKINTVDEGIYSFESLGTTSVAARLLDQNGNYIGGDIPIYTNFRFFKELSANSVYYLEVRANNPQDTGNYKILTSFATDDYANSVYSAESVQIDTDFTGSVNYKGDKDFIMFTVPEGGGDYFIIKSVGDTPIQAELYYDNCSYISSSGGYNNNNINFNLPFEAGKTYRMGIWGSNADILGDYCIKFEVVIDDYGNSISDAKVLPIGTQTSGKIENRADKDFFCFTTLDSGYYIVDCTGDDEIFGSLYDENGTILSSDLRGGGVLYNPIALPLEGNKKYYIQIYNAANACEYNLLVNNVTDDHGNNIASATPLQLGTILDGNIEVIGDGDFFSFIAPEDGYYIIQSLYPEGSDSLDVVTKCYLYDSNGVLLETDEGNTFSFARSFIKGYKYYFKVCSEDSHYGVEYNTGRYRIQVRLYSWDDYGNDFGTATPISTDTVINGSIEYTGDEDIFKFVPAETGIYSIGCFSTDECSITVDGYLYDDDGNLLEHNELLSDPGFTASHELIEGNTYYIRIKNLSNVSDEFSKLNMGDYVLYIYRPVATLLNIRGADAIIIPGSGNISSTYSIDVYDQYMELMTGVKTTLVLENGADGVGYNDNGMITVDSSAVPGSSFNLKAVCIADTSLEVNKNIMLVTIAPDDMTIEITGPSQITIPLQGFKIANYTATVRDHNNILVNDQKVVWCLENPAVGIGIDVNTGAVILFNPLISQKEVKIKAYLFSNPSVYSDMNINLLPSGTTGILIPNAVSFDKNNSAQTDIQITMNLNEDTLSGIKNGTTMLENGKDYTVTGNKVILKKSYLSGLPVGHTILKFHCNSGAELNLDITVSDSTPPVIPGGGGFPGGGGIPDGGGVVPVEGTTPDETTQKPENGTLKVAPVKEYNIAKADIGFEDYQALLNSTSAVEGVKNVIISLKDIDLDEYHTQLPFSAFISETKDVILTICTPVASVTLPSNMFESKNAQGAQSIGINLAVVDKSTLSLTVQDAIGNSPVIEISATVNGNVREWSNPNTPVTVSIPYILKSGEDIDHITVFYIDSEGKLVNMQGVYNPNTKMLTFSTTHFSKYFVKNNKITFTDLKGFESYSKYIESMSAKGIIGGIGNNSYAPGKVLTRAEFATLLVKMLQLDITNKSNVFVDVKASDWYAPYINAAYKAGLIEGIGTKKFAPNNTITMQDAAIILVRALKYKGKTINAGTLSKIKDSKDISKYAMDSVGFAVFEGIMPLDSNGRFNAKSMVNRALAAKYIYNVFNLNSNLK